MTKSGVIIIITHKNTKSSKKEIMLFSRKDLFKIIWPLMLQQLLTVTIGMIDSVMVSSAGDAAVSGVSLVNTLDLFLIYVFLALATGGAVVISQALGRRDKEFACGAAKQLVYAVLVVSTVLTATVVILRKPLLALLFGDVEDAVMENALDYFLYVALSFPFLGIYESIAATFRAAGNSIISLRISLVMNLLNVGGNAFLIYALQMGAAGAAIATLASRVIGAGIMLVLIHNKRLEVYITKLFSYKPDWRVIKSMLRIGVPSGIENGVFQLGKLMTQSLVSTFSTATIAANAVASSIASLHYVPGNAIGTASVAVVGKCIGAGEERQAKKYSRVLLCIAYVSLFVLVAVMSLFLRQIIGIYDVSAESAALARDISLYHGFAAVFLWPVAFCLPHVFRSASDVKFTLVTSITSMWIFRVILGYFFALESVSVFGLVTLPGLGLGVMGVWYAMTVDWCFRFALYLVRFLRGKWLSKHRVRV